MKLQKSLKIILKNEMQSSNRIVTPAVFHKFIKTIIMQIAEPTLRHARANIQNLFPTKFMYIKLPFP